MQQPGSPLPPIIEGTGPPISRPQLCHKCGWVYEEGCWVLKNCGSIMAEVKLPCYDKEQAPRVGQRRSLCGNFSLNGQYFTARDAGELCSVGGDCDVH